MKFLNFAFHLLDQRFSVIDISGIIFFFSQLVRKLMKFIFFMLIFSFKILGVFLIVLLFGKRRLGMEFGWVSFLLFKSLIKIIKQIYLPIFIYYSFLVFIHHSGSLAFGLLIENIDFFLRSIILDLGFLPKFFLSFILNSILYLKIFIDLLLLILIIERLEPALSRIVVFHRSVVIFFVNFIVRQIISIFYNFVTFKKFISIDI